MSNNPTKLIFHVRRDLSRLSDPTSWFQQIKKMYYSQMINIQDQVSLETPRNEDPIASPGNLFNCLITLAVNFPLSQAKISPLN